MLVSLHAYFPMCPSRPSASGPDLLLFGRPSGLISRRWTTFSPRSRLANDANLSALIFPTGRSRALTRAGAMGSKGSRLILTRGDGPSSPSPGFCVEWGREVLESWRFVRPGNCSLLYYDRIVPFGCFEMFDSRFLADVAPETGSLVPRRWRGGEMSWSLVGVKRSVCLVPGRQPT